MPHLWLTSDILTIYLYCFCALPVLRCLNDLCYYISNTQQFKIEWKMFSLCYQLAAKTTGKVRLQSIRNLNVWGKWHWLFLQLTGRSHQLLLLDLQNRMTPLWLLRKVIIFVSFPLHPGCHSDCMTFSFWSHSHSEGPVAGPCPAARHCPRARDKRAGARCVETKYDSSALIPPVYLT